MSFVKNKLIELNKSIETNRKWLNLLSDINYYIYNQSSYSNKSFSSFLNNKNHNINIQNNDGSTVLMHFSKYCNNILSKFIVKLLLSKDVGANINIQDNRGKTALFHAIANNNSIISRNIIKLLISSEVGGSSCVNTRDCDDYTPLMYSIRYYNNIKDEEIIELILSKNTIDINLLCEKGYTALMLFARYCKSKHIFQLLMDHDYNDIDINMKNNEGMTALMFAVKYDNKEALELLLSIPEININIRNNEGLTALMFAIKYGTHEDEIIDLLLNKEFEVNSKYRLELLIFAIYYCDSPQDEKTIELILDNNLSDINMTSSNLDGVTPLISVIQSYRNYPSDNIIKLLLKRGANLNKYDAFRRYTPLMHAVEFSKSYPPDDSLVEFLLSYSSENGEKVDINHKCINGWTALMLAAAYCRNDSTEKTIELLLTKGNSFFGRGKKININAVTINGWSALMLATRYHTTTSTLKAVEILLTSEKCRNININIRNKTGETALMLATFCPNVDKTIFELLLTPRNVKKEIDINIQNNNGRTALMLAIINNLDINIIETLLSRRKGINNVDINLKDRYGDTALMIAIKKELNINIIKTLLSGGEDDIDINLKNNDGNDALMLTIKYYNKDSEQLFKLLIEKGANINTQDNSGDTILMIIVRRNYETFKPIIKLIFNSYFLNKDDKYKLDLNLKNRDGNTALIVAILNHSSEFIIDLLQYEDINYSLVDNQKNTLLNITILQYHYLTNQKQIIDHLLAKGIDPNIENEYGMNALMYAIINKLPDDIIEILQDKGATINIDSIKKSTTLEQKVLLYEYYIEKIELQNKQLKLLKPIHTQDDVMRSIILTYL